MISKKHKKVFTTLNYIEYFLILASMTGYISISAFAFLLHIPIEFTGSAIGLKICAITAGTKRYMSIIKKKIKKYYKIVFFQSLN